ncbi:MAG: DNA double-strand break repair nuclease NurA [Candidatus Diapherotrites archaeon]
MDISSVIDRAVSEINDFEARQKLVFGKLFSLRSLDFSSVGFPENKIVFPVSKWVANGCVVGVDSGFVSRRFSSIDVVLVRAIASVFGYSNGKLSFSYYYPGFFTFPVPFFSGSYLEDFEFDQSKSLVRLREEVRVAKEVILNYSPKYLFIDGSIVPQYRDKPRKGSVLEGGYSSIINEFESLYSLAFSNGTTLIATVEDSRGKRFCEFLGSDIIPYFLSDFNDDLSNVFDTQLLDVLLKVGERSCAFTYAKDISQHPILQDFSSSWADKIYCLYLKPSVLDRPLRVEFLVGVDNNVSSVANEVASVVFALSSLHREYAYPSVLIDADLHARLSPQEIELVFNKIFDKLGGSSRLRLRRENRPF